jgi:predicted Rossmann fold flavoprotein
MKKYIEQGKVKVLLSNPVSKITTDKVTKKIISVKTKEGVWEAKSFIFATGGVSHPETGSTGDGFRWLKDLGHTVKDPTPTIVPLRVSDPWVHILAGISLSFMKITFYLEGKKQFSKTGKVLFTHFGLSGPLILNCSKKVADLLHEGEVTAKIDAYPDTDLGSLEKKIIKIFDANKNRTLRNAFKEIAPTGSAKGLELIFKDIDFTTKVHSVTKEERKQMVQMLKALPIYIEGLMGFDRAVVADGGVVLSEIDTKTMRSKVYDNLYIVGDLLHVTRPSGGFSLQLCWTTGYVAGKNA